MSITHVYYHLRFPTDDFVERRVGTGASIKLTPVGTPTKNRSASPTVAATANAHTHQRSRLSRQIHPREDVDMDAEGDEDAEGEEGDADDETLYCFCQKQSYGDVSSVSYHHSWNIDPSFLDDCLR